MAGVRPETVRQTVKRVLDRLRGLAAADPHFAPLAGLALLGSGPGPGIATPAAA